MWVGQQVGLYVWVWIGSVFRHLSGAGGGGQDERDGRHRRKQKHLRTACVCVRVYQVSDVHDHDEERAVPVGDGELHLALHLPRRGAEGGLWCSGWGCVQTFCLIISSDGMEEGVDQITLEAETGTTSGPEPRNVPVCVQVCVCTCVTSVELLSRLWT